MEDIKYLLSESGNSIINCIMQNLLLGVLVEEANRYLFIYLLVYFWLYCVFIAVSRLSLVVVSWGWLLASCGTWAFH